jgi:hypothetical protein
MVQNIVIPYVEGVRQTLPEDRQTGNGQQKAVLIWDGHSTHSDELVLRELSRADIISVVLPPNCTSKYQPLDVLFNGLEKRYLTDHFSEWHSQAFLTAVRQDESILDVIPTQAWKKRSLIATLVRAVHEKMQKRPDLVSKALGRSQPFWKAFLPINRGSFLRKRLIKTSLIQLPS